MRKQHKPVRFRKIDAGASLSLSQHLNTLTHQHNSLTRQRHFQTIIFFIGENIITLYTFTERKAVGNDRSKIMFSGLHQGDKSIHKITCGAPANFKGQVFIVGFRWRKWHGLIGRNSHHGNNSARAHKLIGQFPCR